MTQKVISVLTYKSVQNILLTGGSQSWALDRDRARNCEFAILCRNARTRDAEGPEPHGTAFMIGKIKDVVPSTTDAGRWLILFSEYALIDWPDQWEGRNPVAYWDLDQYDDDYAEQLNDLIFEKMPVVDADPAPKNGLSIKDAKSALAKSHDVPEESIEIIIRY